MCKNKKEFKVSGDELLKKVKDLVHQGNIRKVIIKDETGKTYLEIPVNVGIIGFILAPVWASIGALAALASKFTIEVIKKEEPPVEEVNPPTSTEEKKEENDETTE